VPVGHRGADLVGDEGALDERAALVVADGMRRRPHLCRAVLSHSRKGFSEAVWRQDTESAG
jgi:hypothetical protein